jgi:hypothetical protein
MAGYLDFLPWGEQMSVMRALYQHRVQQPLSFQDEDVCRT